MAMQNTSVAMPKTKQLNTQSPRALGWQTADNHDWIGKGCFFLQGRGRGMLVFVGDLLFFIKPIETATNPNLFPDFHGPLVQLILLLRLFGQSQWMLS